MIRLQDLLNHASSQAEKKIIWHTVLIHLLHVKQVKYKLKYIDLTLWLIGIQLFPKDRGKYFMEDLLLINLFIRPMLLKKGNYCW